MNKKREKALDDFLDDDECEKLEELFYQTVKEAFNAGYKAKKSMVIPQIIISEKEESS